MAQLKKEFLALAEENKAYPIGAGKHTITVRTEIEGPGKAGTATILVDQNEVAKVNLTRTVPAAFTATETFDVGVDLGPTVDLGYLDRRPFEFEGSIKSLKVRLK